MGITHTLIRWLLPILIIIANSAHALSTSVLPDGRRVHIIKNDILLDAVGDFLVDRVEEFATAAIAEKGAFSMSIGSGTTVTPLVQLADRDLDFSKVHIFFSNERTEGDASRKCAKSGADVFAALNIPDANLHLVPQLPADEAAIAYESMMKDLPRNIVGAAQDDDDDTGLPVLDLCLLGSGADGHCASLYPKSYQVVCSPGGTRAYLPAEGKGGITITIDMLNRAHNVLVSAGKASQCDTVRKCLGWSNAATNHAMPVGMISTSGGANVEWILTQDSAADLPAM